MIAMQAEWDEGRSAYPAQHATLVALTSRPPPPPRDPAVLLDETGAWP